ncbi:MAG: competence/damage-inducible protein A [Bryobacteraceae bacterium]|nr:competence/damage-inducible protein A [Bryobacteraceae bacterium]
MNAEIIAIGSELLTPKRVDTNSLFLTDELNTFGVEVVMKAAVGDDRERLAAVVKAAVERSEIVILTGGLGPTEDDVTRDAVAQALGRALVYREDLCDAIEARFRRMGRKMAEINKRQAFIIEGAEAMPNDRGTAPGLWIAVEANRVVALLPGPPEELQSMFARECRPRLAQLVPPLVIRRLQYRVAGMPESDVDQLIAPVYKEYQNPATTILAAPGDIQIHLRARCETDAEAVALLALVGARIEALLGDRIYSRGGETLEEVVGQLLRNGMATLSVAESCTGGMLAERITSVPGSSDYFVGGFLVYNDAMKIDLLRVDPSVLERYTSVSELAAIAMAEGARDRTGSTFALSVTGIAGPGGGTDENPAGTVWIGVADQRGAQAKRYRFLGDRTRVRRLSVQTALDTLRCRLLAPAGAGIQRARPNR